LVKPAARRAAVRHVQAQWPRSERRACGLIELGRSTMRYRGRSRDDTAVRARLRELAAEKRRWGYRRLCWQLRREGMPVNHKRVERIYREEGLSLRRKKRKRACSVARTRAPEPVRPNEVWCLDFVHDQLYWGRRFRVLNVLDVFTREALAIEVDTSISGARVARVLDRVVAERGQTPTLIVMDNGPELTSRALDQWAYARGVRLHFIEPGKPVQNAFIESFNDKFRDECLNEHWFTTIWDVREKTQRFQREYNRERPHSSLGNQTPEEFRAAFRRPLPEQRLDPVGLA
jgi:putative transposase